VALHRACGFTDAGRLKEVGDKHGRRIDTVLMQRGLRPGGTVPG
jgi:L-amino acid N-acyltransferase YncA